MKLKYIFICLIAITSTIAQTKDNHHKKHHKQNQSGRSHLIGKITNEVTGEAIAFAEIHIESINRLQNTDS